MTIHDCWNACQPEGLGGTHAGFAENVRPALLARPAMAMFALMAFKKTKGGSGGDAFRSAQSGRFLETKSMNRSAHSSFGLPNGQRITTVRRDIMDRALNRSPEKKG